jgi:Predicted deacetylase
MSKVKNFVVDFDDLCDATVGELEVLKQIKAQYNDFKVTLFTIPQRTSDTTIAAAKALGEWCQIAPHGWWHTRGECYSWSSEEAVEKIAAAKQRGIDAPAFRAPGWLLDGDVYVACRELDYTICSHAIYRIPKTGVKEYVYNDVTLRGKGTRAIHGHLTPVSGNFIRDMDRNGKLTFGEAKRRTFSFPWEEGVYITQHER